MSDIKISRIRTKLFSAKIKACRKAARKHGMYDARHDSVRAYLRTIAMAELERQRGRQFLRSRFQRGIFENRPRSVKIVTPQHLRDRRGPPRHAILVGAQATQGVTR